MHSLPQPNRRRSTARHNRILPSRAFGIEPLEQRTMLTLIGQSLFPADNAWNQRVDQAPVAANSATIMNAIVSQFGNGRLHPDFGQDYRTSDPLYGIPYNVVHGNSTPLTHVVIDDYAGESDLKDAPIPASPVLEGDLQTGPTAGVGNRGDSHLLVWDEDNNVAYEFFYASRPSENADGHWHAAGEAVWDMKTNSFRTIGWTSADAAGLAILPGLVRPDEGLPASEGGQGAINHAIRFTLTNSVILDQFIYPASHVANPGNTDPTTQPPMGARFRLKANVDISTLNPESRVIAQAMKSYGMIVADNGSNFFFTGASYAVDSSNNDVLTWKDNDIQDSLHGLKSLHFSDFEVVDLTPAVTGLSTSSGPAGTQVTVTGRNFAGAAGRLQVFFGSTPAASVTVVDDAHVLAVAPAGSGTVDVRVQSGVSDPNDAENINSPVFGYGASATSAADRFTYTAAPNQRPSVNTFTAGVPSPVTMGKDVPLAATAADPDGDAIGKISFYEDRNLNGIADPDELIGTDSDGSDGWSYSFGTYGHSAGASTLLAVAFDAQGLGSAPRPLQIELALPGVLGGPGSVYTVTGSAGSESLLVAQGSVSLTQDLSGVFPNIALKISSNASATLNSGQHFSSIDLSNGATVTAAAGPLTIGSLSIDPTSALDLKTSDLLADRTLTPASTIRSYLVAGYAGNQWTGPGIRSSTAAGDPSHFSLGYADGGVNSDAPPGQVLVRYTRRGDANLDRNVDIQDLLRFRANAGTPTPAQWWQADFTYDGKVDIQDLLAFRANSGASASEVVASPFTIEPAYGPAMGSPQLTLGTDKDRIVLKTPPPLGA